MIHIYQETSDLVFKAIKETFPFASEENFLDFKDKYSKYYNDLSCVKNDHSFFIYLRKFIVSIRNSHTRLGNISNQKIFKPKGYDAVIVNSKFYLKEKDEIIGEIISIDDKSIQDALQERIDVTAGSTKQYITLQALKNIFIRKEAIEINLKLKNKNQIIKKTLSCQSYVFKKLDQSIKIQIFENDLGYIKILTWENGDISEEDLENKINELIDKNIKALIIDVRGNSGGNSNIAKSFASHFFSKKVLFSVTETRVSKDNFDLEKTESYVEPVKPFLDIPVILLVDALCLSSNEYFVAGMKDNNRAILIGETTGGGSGCPKKFDIPFRNSIFSLFVSTWNYYRPNGELLEGNGIKPDIVVKPTLDGLRDGRDEVLERAVEEAVKNSQSKKWDWGKFVNSTKNRKPTGLLIEAVSLLESCDSKKGKALDLGCGAGVDARFLFQKGYDVVAVDSCKCCVEETSKDKEENIKIVHKDIIDFNIDSNVYQIIVAWNSLQFLNDKDFKKVLKNIQNSIIKDGVFVFSFLGTEDSWANKHPEMSFSSKEEIKEALNEMKIIKIVEEKQNKAGATGKVKFWHLIRGIAKKG